MEGPPVGSDCLRRKDMLDDDPEAQTVIILDGVETVQLITACSCTQGGESEARN